MSLGKRLVALRKKSNLTQKELADKLNISRGALSLYELGTRNPDYEVLQKIANFFDVSVDYLLGRTDNPKARLEIPEDYAKKHGVTNRDIKQYENFIEHAQTFFMDDEVAEEDKEKIFRDITELFWESKEKNKKKFGRKKGK